MKVKNKNCKRRTGVFVKGAVLFLVLAVAAALFCGCSLQSGRGYPVTVQDVTISKKPEKIVLLSESLADVVAAVGGEDLVCAVTQACTQSDFSQKPVVDAADAGAVAALQPDVVLCDDALSQEALAALQQQKLCVVVIPAAANRADLQRLYDDVAMVFAGSESGAAAGSQTCGNVLQTLDDITRIVPKGDTLTTACVLFGADGTGATGDTLINSLLTSAGLTNVLAGQTGGEFDFSVLKVSNPTYIFCPQGVKDELLANPDYAALDAVAGGRVTELPAEMLARQGRTVISLAAEFAGTAFPELIGGLTSEEVSSVPTTYATLQKGDSGDAVYQMQKRLYELNYMYVTTYDGEYGTITANCVSQFQQYNGLPVTGTADQETLALLYSDAAVPNPQTH